MKKLKEGAMKKAITVFLVVVMALGALGITATASNYDACADVLKELGLFRGGDTGDELDSPLTRAQALVMQIRLFGLEEEAQAAEGSIPFTDVPQWVERYVVFAHQNGFTNGISATAFGPDLPCDAKTYVTFVLRALGYSDATGGDFSWAEAVSFGKELGIATDALASDEFLRSKMVAVSYLSLAAAPKDGEYDSLLAKLVADGAVDADAAAPILEQIANGKVIDTAERLEIMYAMGPSRNSDNFDHSKGGAHDTYLAVVDGNVVTVEAVPSWEPGMGFNAITRSVTRNSNGLITESVSMRAYGAPAGVYVGSCPLLANNMEINTTTGIAYFHGNTSNNPSEPNSLNDEDPTSTVVDHVYPFDDDTMFFRFVPRGENQGIYPMTAAEIEAAMANPERGWNPRHVNYVAIDGILTLACFISNN